MAAVLHKCVATARVVHRLTDAQVATQPIMLPEALVGLAVLAKAASVIYFKVSVVTIHSRVRVPRQLIGIMLACIMVVRLLAGDLGALKAHVVLLAGAPLLQARKLSLLPFLALLVLLIILGHDYILYLKMRLFSMATVLRGYVVARRPTLLLLHSLHVAILRRIVVELYLVRRDDGSFVSRRLSTVLAVQVP